MVKIDTNTKYKIMSIDYNTEKNRIYIKDSISEDGYTFTKCSGDILETLYKEQLRMKNNSICFTSLVEFVDKAIKNFCERYNKKEEDFDLGEFLISTLNEHLRVKESFYNKLNRLDCFCPSNLYAYKAFLLGLIEMLSNSNYLLIVCFKIIYNKQTSIKELQVILCNEIYIDSAIKDIIKGNL